MENTKINKRQAIGKKLRFEVFKRDKFQCQYCGKAAPDVILHVDHITAVSQGGSSNILNLVTACQPCNSGKSDILLDDHTSVTKARNQSAVLQEKREQLEMMMEWQRGLQDLKSQEIDHLCAYWEKIAPGYLVSEAGKADLRKLLKKYSSQEITSAMDTSAIQYLKFNDSESCTDDSWGIGFNKISGICRVEKESKDNPDIRELYYIRGIARNRFPYFKEYIARKLLDDAIKNGVTLSDLKDIARTAPTWTSFQEEIQEAIEIILDVEESFEPEAAKVVSAQEAARTDPRMKALTKEMVEAVSLECSLQWIGVNCDYCFKPILPYEGVLEYLAYSTKNPDARWLRFVHKELVGEPSQCSLTAHAEKFKTAGDEMTIYQHTIEGLESSSGIMELLNLLETGDLPQAEVVEAIKRIQCPGYELVRPHLEDAEKAGAFVRIGEGNHVEPWQVEELLTWLGGKPGVSDQSVSPSNNDAKSVSAVV